MKNKETIKFIDLFAGIGGMRIGFEDAGAQCVLTCEIDDAAMTTYKENYKPEHNHKFSRDILNLGLGSDFVPDHNILVAGFPCQPYSIAGLRKGLKDERGGDIFKAILRILNKNKPDAFLLENVKGIVNHENGETFKFMITSLAECGYHIVPPEVLNSMTHANVPQNRERVFVVGFKDPEKAAKFKYPNEVKLSRTIHDCLESVKAGEEFYYTEEKYDCTKALKVAMKNKDTIYQWRRQYVRENKSNACPTLTANMGSGGHNVPLILDSFGIRKLTPRETANFQGFPRSFKLPKLANSKLYHQFGNSVTVPLIKKIATEIIKVL
ncbi:DNA (cytosine-5-)-methyltransferase [Polynucleobacter sp. Adler-ghost]|uniref:DNA (cytosine-5-)-methyltransferase n=1 Tax=Polynucleobacter sp. Adler-ghost TaxID=2770234 RepID=UPI001BFDA00E|nr:DNA (cytosine-5-)-methyltransferase [Polynucleobacter sp. Adler-ghost]QWE29900.1 DNA (cytosine-5-)-methyltransferase [Polynucleobacter sp. Adler-ghost]